MQGLVGADGNSLSSIAGVSTIGPVNWLARYDERVLRPYEALCSFSALEPAARGYTSVVLRRWLTDMDVYTWDLCHISADAKTTGAAVPSPTSTELYETHGTLTAGVNLAVAMRAAIKFTRVLSERNNCVSTLDPREAEAQEWEDKLQQARPIHELALNFDGALCGLYDNGDAAFQHALVAEEKFRDIVERTWGHEANYMGFGARYVVWQRSRETRRLVRQLRV
jgi:hypothetical protein